MRSVQHQAWLVTGATTADTNVLSADAPIKDTSTCHGNKWHKDASGRSARFS